MSTFRLITRNVVFRYSTRNNAEHLCKNSHIIYFRPSCGSVLGPELLFMAPIIPYSWTILGVSFKVLDGSTIFSRPNAQLPQGRVRPIWSVFPFPFLARESCVSPCARLTASQGSLARVGPNELVTNDPDLLRKMMGVRSSYTRGEWYDAIRLDPGRNNLLSTRDDDAHTKMRRKMAPGVRQTLRNRLELRAKFLIVLGERK